MGRASSLSMGALWMALSVAGCADHGSGLSSGVRGELGLAAFGWGCLGDGDLGCTAEGFGQEVAVGADFEITARASSVLPDEVHTGRLVAASPDRVERQAGWGPDDWEPRSITRFTALSAGRFSVMLLSTSDDVIDYAHVEAAPVDHLALRRLRDEGEEFEELPTPPPPLDMGLPIDSVRLIPGTLTYVRAEPLDEGGQPLVGNLPFEWETTDEQVATVVRTEGNEATIDTHRTGDVEIVVTTGDIEGRFWFRAQARSEGPTRRRPGEDDSTGGDTDTSDTDTSETDTGETDTGTDGATSGGMQ